MMAKQKTYIAIDLKSFYASVECKERNRDPLTTNLVVADKSRTEKTICLAVSPSLKSYGIPGRPRLFEVVQKVKEANNNRRWKAPNRTFTGSSDDSTELNANPALEMGDIARCSIGKPNELYNEELLYKLFGINAELLIDHAWGYEPCTMEQVKAYKPETNSVCSGQVLHCPYDYEKAKLIVKEMTDQMVLDLVDKGLVTDQLVLTIGYDIENLSNPNLKYQYKGEVTIDRYGRKVPKHAHGTANLEKKTSSTRLITNAVMDLYDRIVDEHLLVRRITITANKLVDEKSVKQEDEYQQLDLFTDYEAQRKKQAEEEEKLERERRMQEAMLSIKKKFGKNAVLKGMNLEEGATAKDRNEQIGGHKA